MSKMTINLSMRRKALLVFSVSYTVVAGLLDVPSSVDLLKKENVSANRLLFDLLKSLQTQFFYTSKISPDNLAHLSTLPHEESSSCWLFEVCACVNIYRRNRKGLGTNVAGSEVILCIEARF